MQFIDSHSHLDFSEFDEDRDTAIIRANEVGVTDVVVSSTVAERWSLVKQVTVCRQSNATICHAAYGLHPMFMQEHKQDDLDLLKLWLTNNDAVAVGEIGLDFFIPKHDKQQQIELFVSQLALAAEFKLPVIIHARKSLDIVLKHLRQFPHVRGSIHCFSGSEQQAKQLIDLGYYLGFGGPITYDRALNLRRLVKSLPLEAMLLESDAPDQPDSTHYKQRNEPAFIPLIAKTIAKLRGIELESVAEKTTQNAKTLFGI